MKLSEFLNLVLPDAGVRIIAHKCEGTRNGKTFTYFKHVPCDSHDKVRETIKKLVPKKTDIYFALASFKQGFHKNEKGKKVIRVQENVESFKAVWLDIDFKDGLSTPEEVTNGLRQYAERSQTPLPSLLVHSGHGIHAYWPFTEAVPINLWRQIAMGLKQSIFHFGLRADLACTADACRVLRPIGTVNWKNPLAPKVVKGVSTGKLFDPEELGSSFDRSISEAEAILRDTPEYLRTTNLDTRDTASLCSTGITGPSAKYRSIIEKCAVSKHAVTSTGRDASEPEWTAHLQLLAHCTDGKSFIHKVSNGHAGYSKLETEHKFQQRLDNTAGPTLCSTFHQYHPDVCKACIHYGKIKSPITLGENVQSATPAQHVGTGPQSASSVLTSWRPLNGNIGMERRMWDKASNKYLWEKVLHRTWMVDQVSRSAKDQDYSIALVGKLGTAHPISVSMPSGFLGKPTDLCQLLAQKGLPLRQAEVPHFRDLMTNWLEKVQQSRNVDESTDQLGWVENGDPDNPTIIGFAAGSTTFYTDGSVRKGVKAKPAYEKLAKLYYPKGSFRKWQEAADFLTLQDKPEFTAILATAFATPLMRFTGMPGAIISLVSTQSGVGKTSALRVAQAVWGNPTNGMNSTNDTHLSVIRKAGFLQNLPVYWDEIRGQKAMEAFGKVGYDIAQGKERARLNQSADLREVNSWHTMAIGASNESVFDFMGTQSGSSDAGIARTFEIVVGDFEYEGRIAQTGLFGALGVNYGRAGQKYAEHLALHHETIAAEVEGMCAKLEVKWELAKGERFWAALASALIIGARHAQLAGVCGINLTTLTKFLRANVQTLRERSGAALLGTSPRELVIGYMQAHQDGQLTVKEFVKRGRSAEDRMILASPSHRLMVEKAGDSVRVRAVDFKDWLKRSKGLAFSAVEGPLSIDLKMKKISATLGARTKWELPKGRCLEFVFPFDSEK